MKSFTLISVLFIGSIAFAGPGDDPEEKDEKPLMVEFLYASDLFYNFSGGLQTGGTYMGLMSLGLTLDGEQAGLWPGSQFSLELMNTHGGTASETYLGDFHVMSNIENGNYTWLYQLTYQQSLGDFELLLGLHDLNAEFHVSDFAGYFLNSSFGIVSTIAAGVPIAIFPKNALSAILKYQFSPRATLRLGVYDGDPGTLDDDPYGIKFRLSQEEGFLYISEMELRYALGVRRPGSIKLGSHYHSGSFAVMTDSSRFSNNWGVHLLADQLIIPTNKPTSGIGMFLQIGYVPGSINRNDQYYGFGLTYQGMFSRDEDKAGLAIADARMSQAWRLGETSERNEAVLEAFYHFNLNEKISIQPDLQYIINPNADQNLKNCLAGICRFNINLSH